MWVRMSAAVKKKKEREKKTFVFILFNFQQSLFSVRSEDQRNCCSVALTTETQIIIVVVVLVVLINKKTLCKMWNIFEFFSFFLCVNQILTTWHLGPRVTPLWSTARRPRRTSPGTTTPAYNLLLRVKSCANPETVATELHSSKPHFRWFIWTF